MLSNTVSEMFKLPWLKYIAPPYLSAESLAKLESVMLIFDFSILNAPLNFPVKSLISMFEKLTFDLEDDTSD